MMVIPCNVVFIEAQKINNTEQGIMENLRDSHHHRILIETLPTHNILVFSVTTSSFVSPV
jgi:hypothetical protein